MFSNNHGVSHIASAVWIGLTDSVKSNYVLVTGATGLIGAHVVDRLLKRGCRVRMAVRSKEKADFFASSRPGYRSQLDFFFIKDLADDGVFNGAVDSGINSVIHVASPLRYDLENNEEALIKPAILGVRSILQACFHSQVRRIVLTSSFAAVLNLPLPETLPRTYTAKDWNPITYAEAVAPSASSVEAYRGSKTFAEQEAWKFMASESPSFDLVTLCPPLVFGPLATPPKSLASDLNESNKFLWKILSGTELPLSTFNFWIDVRDLAEIHVQALMKPSVGGKRYVPVSNELFTYNMAAEIIKEELPPLSDKIPTGDQPVRPYIRVDLEPLEKDIPEIHYTPFRETVVDFARQFEPFLGR